MTEPRVQDELVVRGRSIDVSSEGNIISGTGAEILQATPRSGTAIQLGQFRSEETKSLTVTDKDDVVELVLEDNLLLYTSVGRLKEDIAQPAARGEAGAAPELPARISFTSRQTRGEGGLLVNSFKILNIESIAIGAAGKKGGALAARKIAEMIEDRLIGPDVLYQLGPETGPEGNASFTPVTEGDIDISEPLLLFIHGTASSTEGSFSQLWNPEHPVNDTIWADLHQNYNNNIFALEHRTLTHSPIDNAVDLLRKIPAGCRLHLVSHSRGGLVGELLCRAQFNNSREPFTEEDIALFNITRPGADGLLAETKKDYQHHKQQLKELNKLFRQKQPVIERFVRVACPARGTTLASGKLDFYLSGILNVIGLIPALKASPVYNLLKTFVLAVAKERTRPDQLPGLEAQMPGSPFIAMLNSAPESVKAHLAVIKGDIEPVGILKKISLFFLDRFYESDHDLVVNTPSMDGGARRERPVPVLFDQGKEINHFRYFANPTTRSGLFSGLTDTALPPPGFQLERPKPVEIARTLPRGKTIGDVPTVFILPGITGSHLGVGRNRIWIDFFDLIRGKFSKLKITAPRVLAQAVVAKAYGDLIEHFAESHHVIPFPYDWRSSILESGEKLGAEVHERLLNSDKPVRIIAHSMGGLVTRAMMSRCKEVWDQMRDRTGSRVLMLGTPNRGSYSIPRIFARQDRLIQMLALADLHHNQNELLDIIRKFPGVLELLPINEDGEIAVDDTLWNEFSEALGRKWKKPTREDLGRAQRTWDALTRQDLDPSTVFYIAGHKDETPCSVAVEETGGKEKEILFTPTDKGDGQVPWETGIPRGIDHWYVNATHGDIPDHKPAYTAFQEILETGGTRLLATQPPQARGVEKGKIMLPDSVDIFPNEEQLLRAGLGKDVQAARIEEPSLPSLHVSVTHGNLCFAGSPLAVGHYQGDTIVSAEAVLDELLDHRLSKRQQKGVYPGPLNSNEILFNDPADRFRFKGAVIVGLGEVGKLTPGGLTSSFRDAVIRFVLNGSEANYFNGKPIELSTLLIGTSVGGLSVQDSLTALIRGVLQANRSLAGDVCNRDLIVSKLEFLELNEDIAIAAQHALVDSGSNIEFCNSVVTERFLVSGNGGRTRAYFDDDADWWRRLRIEATKDGGLKYTTLEQTARADMRIQPLQRQSVEPFLQELTTSTSADTSAGRVLFELIVPPELKSHAAGNQKLMLVIDKEAAAYPWELLEYAGREGDEALAIKAGMIRQLSTQNIVPSTVCSDLKALVIGDPDTGAKSVFPQLQGAQKEAQEVAQVLGANSVDVDGLLLRDSGAAILTRLMTGRYGILHLAGHGVVDFELPRTHRDNTSEGTASPEAGRVTGMVIGHNQFLTPVEIRQMPFTPAFVFINCCHLGKITGQQKHYMDQRYKLAANLATQLIEQGVKAVIAAGWAVDDKAARVFATSFYERFLKGMNFGDAVQAAREKTQQACPMCNTWGAYQCYGDPGYRITDRTGQAKTGYVKPLVSLAEFRTAVKNIGEDAKTASQTKTGTLCERLTILLEAMPEAYGHDAKLLAAAGEAWGELDHFEKGIDAYTRALEAQRAYAPLCCAEQLANLKARRAIEVARQGKKKEALELADDAGELLQTLNERFKESVERLCLLGSLYKRRAEINITNRNSLLSDIGEMEAYYMRAHENSLQTSGRVSSYPLLNGLTARWLLHLATGEQKHLEDFDSLLESARRASMIDEINQENFWEAIALTDCELLETLWRDQLSAEKADNLADNYQKIARVASSPRQMRSVLEHIASLTAMTKRLDLTMADNLHKLRTRLKRTQ